MRGVVRLWFCKVLRYFALVLSAFWSLAVLACCYSVFRVVDPQGESSENCIRSDLPSNPNGFGMIATAHTTYCDYFIAHGNGVTYIYVHGARESDSRSSLVFRFDNGDREGAQQPQIRWSGKSSLHISVGTVGEVTKQVNSVEGVKISYSIEKEQVARGESFRLKMYFLGVMLILFIGGVCGCVLAARSILRHRRAF
jgi:hypothetical protein